MKEQPQAPRRVFIGIRMPDDVAQKLAGLQSDLTVLPVRLIPREDFHLTLVPPWQETMVIAASQILRDVVAHTPAFRSEVQKLSYGPDPLHPRLVWAPCATSEELIGLKKKLLAAFGMHDPVPFAPHVTLARFTEADDAAPRTVPLDLPLDLPFPIDRVQLFESPNEGGSGYTVLYDFSLSTGDLPH